MEAAEDLVSLCESVGRPDDMIRAIRPVLSPGSGVLSPAHRELVHDAYKAKIISLLKAYHRTEKAVCRNAKEFQLREEYLAHIRSEVQGVAQEIIDLVHYRLLVFENTVEGVIFYQKCLGDYYRYMAEAGDSEAAAMSNQHYLKALDRVPQLPVYHPIRLSLVLNYSVFFHDIRRDLREATIIAKEGFDLAIKEVHDLEPALYKEVMEYLELLRDSIKHWKEERRLKAQVPSPVPLKAEVAVQ